MTVDLFDVPSLPHPLVLRLALVVALVVLLGLVSWLVNVDTRRPRPFDFESWDNGRARHVPPTP